MAVLDGRPLLLDYYYVAFRITRVKREWQNSMRERGKRAISTVGKTDVRTTSGLTVSGSGFEHERVADRSDVVSFCVLEQVASTDIAEVPADRELERVSLVARTYLWDRIGRRLPCGRCLLGRRR